MNKFSVDKFAKKSVDKLFKSFGKNLVKKSKNDSFPYKSTYFGKFFQTKSTRKSTWNLKDSSLLNESFTHFPHSLLLLLLNI